MSGSIAVDNLAKSALSSSFFATVVATSLNSGIAGNTLSTVATVGIVDIFFNYVWGFPTSLNKRDFFASIAAPAVAATSIHYFQLVSEGFASDNPYLEIALIFSQIACGFMGSRLMNSVNLFGTAANEGQSLEEMTERVKRLAAFSTLNGVHSSIATEVQTDSGPIVEILDDEVEDVDGSTALSLLEQSPGRQLSSSREISSLSMQGSLGLGKFFPNSMKIIGGQSEFHVQEAPDGVRRTELKNSFTAVLQDAGAQVEVKEEMRHTVSSGGEKLSVRLDFKIG
ncbi:MAG: hypothetical protein KR126chlam1_00993 [Chlamydiae bacterium]|nr:hypothetical protein [Chlamydiota bacterium]